MIELTINGARDFFRCEWVFIFAEHGWHAVWLIDDTVVVRRIPQMF